MYGVGCAQNLHYYVMQLITGVSLSHAMRQMSIHQSVASQAAMPTSDSGTTNNAFLPTHSGLSHWEWYNAIARLTAQEPERSNTPTAEGIVRRDIKMIDERRITQLFRTHVR